MTKTAAEMVKAARSRIENLSIDQLTAELQENDDLLIVDLREGEERQQHGVIPQAVAIPRGVLEFHVDAASPMFNKEFSPDRRIVLHCASGGRSALAADLLQEMGYTNIAHLNGGFGAWKKAGRPVETHEMWRQKKNDE